MNQKSKEGWRGGKMEKRKEKGQGEVHQQGDQEGSRAEQPRAGKRRGNSKHINHILLN